MTDTAVTVSHAAALVPATLGEAFRMAELMATAKLVPLALQKSPADCMMVIQQAIRWQMDPFAVAQECSVISGKLMHSGKLTLAVINARGNLQRRLTFTYAGEGEGRSIVVSGLLAGETAARTIDVKLKDAKTTNAMWTKQPDQQLAYFGARAWARRHTPELMLGVYAPEEFDMVDITPDPLPEAVQPQAAPGPDAAPEGPPPGFWVLRSLKLADPARLPNAIHHCPDAATLERLRKDNAKALTTDIVTLFVAKAGTYPKPDHVGSELGLPPIPAPDAETGEVLDDPVPE